VNEPTTRAKFVCRTVEQAATVTVTVTATALIASGARVTVIAARHS
jgi:hypothetical protein